MRIVNQEMTMPSFLHCEIKELKRTIGVSGGAHWMWFEAVSNNTTLAKSDEFPYFSSTPEEIKISEEEKMKHLGDFINGLLKNGWQSESPNLFQKGGLPNKIILKRPIEGK